MEVFHELTIPDELFDREEVNKLLVNPTVPYDFFATFLGSKINSGTYRAVYNYNLGRKNQYVLKIEPGFTSCNAIEASVWAEVKYFTNKLEWVKKWFAPVEWISPNGKILCMQKTEEKPNKKRPTEIPSFLSDVKPENYGWIGNNFVCHDYGHLWGVTNFKKQFKKVNW